MFTINNNVFDLFQLVAFSGIGYLLLKLGCEPAPLLLGFVLGPMMEEYLRRALLISLGDPLILLSSPISAGFLIAAVALLASIAGNGAGPWRFPARPPSKRQAHKLPYQQVDPDHRDRADGS